MAYRHNYQRRRNRRFRRGRYTRKQPSMGTQAWNLAKRAATQVVKYYVNTERKYIDGGIAGEVNTTGAVTFINGLAQGTTVLQRVGDQVKFTSLHLKYFMGHNAAGAQDQYIRIIALIDFQVNGVIATVAQILESAIVNAHREIDFSRRFHVLYDKMHAMAPAGASTNNINDVYLKMDLKPEYFGTAATIAAINTGAVYILTISNIATASEPPTINIQTRMRFIDN